MPRPTIPTALALLLLVTPSCASRRMGPVRTSDGLSHSSTIGSDLRRAPRGVTIPPPALGVDLVGMGPDTPGTSARPALAVMPPGESVDHPGNRPDRQNR